MVTAVGDPERLQHVVSLVNSGDLAAASEAAATLQDKAMSCEAWRLVSRANANLQRWTEARSAIEIALQQRPGTTEIRGERALLLGEMGLADESLAELAVLSRENPDSPQWLGHWCRALQFAGRWNEAEARVEEALRRWPLDLPLHALLIELRWQRGAGAEATQLLERAIEAHPEAPQLRLVAADHLRNAGFTARALELLEGGLRIVPESAAFLTSIGVLIDALDRPHDALPYLRAAIARSPQSVPAQRNLVPTLLRTGAGEEALALADSLLARAPDDQQLIAYRATALRLLGRAEYRRLYDYERLVRVYRLHPPDGDIAAFNAAFARELTALHRAQRRPLAQSLRGGTQTERHLPADNPLVARFFAMLDAPIRDYISRLRDDVHPVDRRRRAGGGYKLSGSWSVQLQPGGFHVDHVHPRGWLSSAYYVELPTEVAGTSRAGWIKFGESGVLLAACPPEHFVKPEPGTLVLFPSYMWHGTVAFGEGGRRLTAAFDVVPD